MKNTQLLEKLGEIDKLNELIELEYGKNKDADYVILDGIVNPEKYFKAGFKILWILKEPHDKGEHGKWDMRELIEKAHKHYGLDKNMKYTFPRIIYSTYGILNGFLSLSEMDKIKENHNMIDIIQNIALINIRKLPGPKESNKKIIEETYQKYSTIILKQIEVYEPDIIIIGVNTINDLNNDLSLDNFKYIQNYPIDYYLSNKRIVIDAYHPLVTKANPKYYGGSVTDEIYCNSIIKAVKNWYKKTN